MKTRIMYQNGRYYPQFKTFIFWNYYTEYFVDAFLLGLSPSIISFKCKYLDNKFLSGKLK